MITPTFQAQNPAISGYSLGWASCQAFVGAMGASYHRQVKKLMTGGALRAATGDRIGGLNHAQIDAALNQKWGIDLATYYRLPWKTAEKFVDAGMAMHLSVWYAKIANSQYDAGRGFRANHEVLVRPGWVVMDPLADGRYGEAYKYVGAPYPRQLLREAAGDLNLATTGYRRLGNDLVYAMFTADRTKKYRLRIQGDYGFWVYRANPSTHTITAGKNGRYAREFTKDVVVDCTPAELYTWDQTPGHAGGTVRRSLVRITSGTALGGKYVALPYGAFKLELA